jgi:hypothetical protein
MRRQAGTGAMGPARTCGGPHSKSEIREGDKGDRIVELFAKKNAGDKGDFAPAFC